MHRRSFAITLVMLFILAGGGIAASTVWRKSAPKPTSSGQAAPKTPQQDSSQHGYLDVDFAQKMIIHDQQAMQITALAATNSSSEVIRGVASRISAQATADSEKYISWLKAWGETYTNLSDFPEMDGHDMYPTYPGMASTTTVKALRASTGSDFDKLFVETMKKHQEGAIEMQTGSFGTQVKFGEMLDWRGKQVTEQRKTLEALAKIRAGL